MKLYNVGTNQRVELGLLFLKKNILSVSEWVSNNERSTGTSFEENEDIFSKSEVKYLNEHNIELSLHFNAYLILIYTFWDTHFKRFCYSLASAFKEKLDFHKLEGKNNMRKGYNFLKNTLRYDLQFLDSEWNKLNNLKEIRDLIIHYNSNFKRRSEKHIDLIKSIKYLNYSEQTGFFYINDKNLLIEYCNVLRLFFNKITGHCESQLEEEIEKLLELKKDEETKQPDLTWVVELFKKS